MASAWPNGLPQNATATYTRKQLEKLAETRVERKVHTVATWNNQPVLQLSVPVRTARWALEEEKERQDARWALEKEGQDARQSLEEEKERQDARQPVEKERQEQLRRVQIQDQIRGTPEPHDQPPRVISLIRPNGSPTNREYYVRDQLMQRFKNAYPIETMDQSTPSLGHVYKLPLSGILITSQAKETLRTDTDHNAFQLVPVNEDTVYGNMAPTMRHALLCTVVPVEMEVAPEQTRSKNVVG